MAKLKKPVKRICENPKCFKEFVALYANQRFCCAACAKAVKIARDHEAVKSTYVKKIHSRGAAPSMTLAQANELARAEGLTYGRYFNRHGYGDWF